MTEPPVHQLSDFYLRCRIQDQQRFYDARRVEYDRAASQQATVTTVLLLVAAAAGFLSSTQLWIDRAAWAIIAAACSAASAIVTTWGALLGFEENSRLYRTASLSLDPVGGPLQDHPDDVRSLHRAVLQAEEILQAETAQWGQHLRASVARIGLDTPAPDSSHPAAGDGKGAAEQTPEDDT
jgi:hypothetical protein